MELVMAHPVSRISLATQRLASVVTALAVNVVVTFLAVTALRGPARFSEVGVGHIAAICLQLFRFGALFAALAFAVGAYTGRKNIAIGASAAVAVVGYRANAFLPQVQGLEWVRNLSPFHWYLGGKPLINGPQWGGSGLVVGFATLLTVGGVLRFQRRDIDV